MIDTQREFCIATMEVLDEWCEENGFETSDFMQAEFAELMWTRMGGPVPPPRLSITFKDIENESN